MNSKPLQLVRSILVAAAVASVALPSSADQPPPQNVLQLSANAAVEVPQDVLMVQLSAVRDGSDPAQVQAQVKQLLDAALNEARRAAQPGLLDVRTGNFSLQPRYNRDGRIASWQGAADLVLEGTDFQRVGQLAGRLNNLNITGSGFRLSREKRAQAEREAQEQAVAQFRAKASELARSFGFRDYGLREVSVQANDMGMPRPRMMAMEAKAASADAPMPVEAGKTSVVVNVSGSVQLR
jgi:predicted secreted protein